MTTQPGSVVDELSSSAFRADQLEGFRIGVTSDRRSEDLIDAFERRGAQVLHAPTLRIAHAQQDDPIIEDTRALIDTRPDVLLATTGYGIRRWFEVADAAGIGDALTQSLSSARILVRGPKARGGVRAAGLNDSGMSEVETTESLITKALAETPVGSTIAIQLHGFTDEQQLDRIRHEHILMTVAPYRWTHIGNGNERVQRLIEATCARQLDAITFTSAPSVDALLVAAEGQGLFEELCEALRSDVVAAAVGPVTAGPLLACGIVPLQPDRFRMGALIRLVCEHLDTARVTRVTTLDGEIVLRGQLVEVAGKRIALPPTSLLLLRKLASSPGAVMSRAELARALPGIQDDHAMEVAISRLRRSLGEPGLVTTIVKRGYRLNV
ncbi:MAG: uroporphyrinogen-III synthase [Rhodoglobus sp.]